MTAPTPHLPLQLIRTLARADRAEASGAAALDTAGVVLFVDISGFSTLASALAESKGGAGIEQLARVVQEKFERIVARIETWGGEVTTFAGDAVIAWWEARGPAEQALALARTLRAGADIEAELTAPIEGIHVRVRQAVAAGPLRALRLGDAPCVALLDGPAIEELADVAGRPPGGAPALTRGAATLAAVPATVPEPPGVATAPPPGFVDPSLASWVTVPGRPPELRVVTPMFTRVVAPDGDAERLHLAVAGVQREVRRHGGLPVSVCRDEKGLAVVSVFGLGSGDAYRPSDPILAAVAVADALGALGIPTCIGIATGRTYVGATRSGDRRRVDLVGTPMNLAARLMMLGPGVHADAASARGGRGVAELGGQRAVRFTGFPAPVAVWRVLRAGGQVAEPLVGRVRALERLLGALDDGGGLLRVTGEPGVGKTALLRQFAARARERGVEVAALPAAADPVVAWPPVVGRAVPPDPDAAESSRGFLRAAQEIDAVTEALRPPPGERRLYLVDDAQHLDERGLAVAERLGAAGVLVVLASRGRATAPQRGDDPLALGPLAPEEVAALVADRLGQAALAPGLVEWLLHRAGGHPHFTLELLAVAQERGFLELDPGGRVVYFDRAGLEASAPPETVEASLAARLDPLPAASVAALKAASAIGREVPRAALAGLVPAVDAAVEPLVDAGWLVPRGAGFAFADATLHEAVHAVLTRDLRRQLHGAILALPGAADLPADVRADHLAHAGRFAEAIAALDTSWAQAAEGGRPRAATAMAVRALALDDEARELGEPTLPATARAAWHHRVAAGSRGYGDTALATRNLEAAAALLDLRVPTSAGGWRRRALAELARSAWERLIGTRSRPGDDLRAAVLNLLALTHYLRSRPAEELLAVAMWSVRLGWRGTDGPAPATALASSMLAVATTSLPRVADALADEGVRRAGDDPRERLDAALGRLLVDVSHARWPAVERAVAATLPLSRAARSDTLHAAFLGIFGVADVFTGQVERAAERAAEMLEVAERESYLQARGWARNLQSTLAMLAGDDDAALRMADEAQAILGRRREPDHLAPYAVRAEVALRRGDLATALREVATLEEQLPGEVLTVTSILTVAVPVEVHLAAATGGERAALVRADRALGRVRAYARLFPVGRARLAWLEAVRGRAAGRDPGPALLAARALAVEMPLELLRIDQLLGADTTALEAGLARGWVPGGGPTPG